MKFFEVQLVSVVATFAMSAAEPISKPAETPKKSSSSEWVFSILPKSMQRNPRLEITVITEMTEAGKRLPLVSKAAPAYIEVFSTGPKHLGHAEGNEATLKQEEIERVLLRSLATNGYQPAKPPEHPPSLVVLYTWGAHATLVEGDSENPVLSGEQIARNLLDRAALVGGEKFARQLVDLFAEADAMSTAMPRHPPPGGQAVITPELFDFANPVARFKRASSKNEFLIDQAASDVYYVVASAYDYASMAANRKTLLWRTRMTVAAQGVSQRQTLPTLVLSAAPYFGRDMPEAEILSRRAVPEGTVEIGTPTVVEPAKK